MQRARRNRLDTGHGTRARGLRTENMELMSVTLDVTKLSGWLNACASCRGWHTEAHEEGDTGGWEARGRVGGGGGARSVHGGTD